MRYLACLALAIGVAALLAAGCSKTNVGALYKSPYQKGDPASIGFGDPDENGAYDVLSFGPGTIFTTGNPEVAEVYPVDGSTAVDVGTIVLLRFTESMASSAAALAAGVQIQKTEGSEPVDGALSYVDGSAYRLVAFVPDAPLEEETEYQVIVAATFTDAQGEAVISEGTVSTFTTGETGDDVAFGVIETMILPESGGENVSERAPVLVFFTEALDRDSVDGEFKVEDRGINDIAGTLSYPGAYDDRLLVFTPDADMPAGNRIEVTVGRRIENAVGNETLGTDVESSFNIISFPRVTAITFGNTGDPLVALPGTVYAGRVLRDNLHQIEVTITTAGSGKSGRTVIFFWDNSDTNKAIIIVDEANRKPGDMKYTVDLMPEAGDALQDGKITVGAYTVSSSGTNGPVGPAAELPLLRKDLEDPELLSLGPPSGAAPGNRQLLLEVASAGVHGRASEDLSAVSVTVDVDGTPQTLDGLIFFSMEFPAGSGLISEEVTRGNDHLFITEPLAGVDPDTATRGPFRVTEVVMTDLVGYTTTLTDPADSEVAYRGYVRTGAGAAHELEVYCYDAVTMLPIEDADVLVDPYDSANPQDPPDPADRLGSQTDADGLAFFDTVSGMPNDHITVTAVKTDYELVSLLALSEPSGANPMRISLPMVQQTTFLSSVSLYISTVGEDPLPQVFVGGNRLVTGTNDTLVDAGEDPSGPVPLAVASTKLQFLEAMGVEADTPEDKYQWAWSNPFLADGVSSIEAVLFYDELKSVDDLTSQVLETAAFPASYLADAEARLVARLDGFTSNLPLGVDLIGNDIGGQLSFEVPMPPSLFINERLGTEIEDADLDPPYEIVIEPALGPVTETKDPDQALLEATLGFEVEGIQAGDDPRIFRRRIPYSEAAVGTPRLVVFPEAAGAPVELFILFIDTVTLPALVQWNATLTITGNDGAYVLYLDNNTAGRRWKVYVPAPIHLGTDQVLFPDLSTGSLPPGFTPANSFADFTSAGDYAFQAEAFAVPGFDLEEGFLSEFDRSWSMYWRSESMTVSLDP